jgi:hypothetical protein
MQESTISRRRVAKVLKLDCGTWLMGSAIQQGRRALGKLSREIGRMIVESVFLIEREEIAGPNYYPRTRGVSKWASQRGSVFVGRHKERVMVSRSENERAADVAPVERPLRASPFIAIH